MFEKLQNFLEFLKSDFVSFIYLFKSPTFLIAILLASIPVAIWLYITIKNEKKGKKIMLLIFGLGSLTAPALLELQMVWGRYPQFDLAGLIEKSPFSPGTIIIFTLLLFATMEEIIKMYIIRSIDKKTLFITKVNDAIKYSIASALGFSFGENIYYLNSLWQEISTGQLAGMYFFRSIFTTAAHMVYSGVFGYFYGIGKFSMVINQQNIVSGKKDKLSAVVARIFNLPLSEGFRQKIILKGLFIAIAMHFTINYLLQLAEGENSRILMPIVLITNILMYLFLQYLLNRKAGHLILLTDPTTQKTSTMAKKDTEVVMELLAMWSKDKRYVDVIHVCERLLQRDPDNNVVKLFKAQAMDAMDEKDIYKKILETVIKTKDDLSIDQKNIISKYVAEKKPTVTTAPSIPVQQAQQKNVLEKFTGEGTFKIH